MAKGVRTSLAGWVASLTPLFARARTTSTTPTGSQGNVAPAIHPTYSFGNQPPTNNQNTPGNDPTALWGNADINRFNDVFRPGTLFGPERPLVPSEYENIRLRNFPVGYNLQYTPRSYEQVGFAPPDARHLVRQASLRYRHQGFELVVPWPSGPVDVASVEAAIAAFHRRHERLYTFAQPDTPVEIVTLRVDVPELGVAKLPVVPAMDQSLVEPEVRRSVNGVLSTSLRCAHAYRDFGGKRLYLRSYEGGLGPTLRIKPGETLKIRLTNDFPPNAPPISECVGLPHSRPSR